MQITVQNIGVTTINKGGKSRPYGEAKVEFLNERGETKAWTLRSFTNPSVFKTLESAQRGQTFEITTTKNDKDYTEWTSATLVATSATPARAVPQAAARSTYETSEERAVKQRLIVRQSSLAQAIAFLPKEAIQSDVLDCAETFAEWVYETPELEQQPTEWPANDIPF